MTIGRESIIGHHLIWTLYGHWLPNDLRGSGSNALRQEKLADLGPIHRGRRPENEQPSRTELREHLRQAEPLLNFSKFWLDATKRHAIGTQIGEIIRELNYTVWACAVITNRAHLVVRRHRDDALRMWHTFADSLRLRHHEFPDIGAKHPVFSDPPYKVLLTNPAHVRTCVSYVERNPAKEGLDAQLWGFTVKYNNWPFHKKR